MTTLGLLLIGAAVGSAVGWIIGFKQGKEWVDLDVIIPELTGVKYKCCDHCLDTHEYIGVDGHTIGCSEKGCFKGNVIVTDN